MDTTQSFNDSHPLSPLLKGSIGADLPTKPEDVDLRFLRMIRLSDTWEGDESPVDGSDYFAVFYGDQLAWKREKIFWGGERQQRFEDGNKLYHDLYHAAQLYLKIQQVAHTLCMRKTLKRGADTFYMREEDLALLSQHPQFNEMASDLGLVLVETRKKGYRKVTVTKFFDPDKRRII